MGGAEFCRLLPSWRAATVLSMFLAVFLSVFEGPNKVLQILLRIVQKAARKAHVLGLVPIDGCRLGAVAIEYGGAGTRKQHG